MLNGIDFEMPVSRLVCRRWSRLGGLCLFLIAMLTGPAFGKVIFQEKFDPMENYSVPSDGWQVAGTDKERQIIVTSERYKDYTLDHSCRLSGDVNKNVWLRSKALGPNKTLWIDAWVFMESDSQATNGAVIGVIDATGAFACDLRLIGEGKGSGTYKAVVLSRDSARRDNSWKTIASGLPIGKWEHWSFGLQITDENGDGFYWVCRNEKPLIQKQPYYAWSKVKSMDRLQFWGDAPRWYVDDITVSDTIPDMPVVAAEVPAPAAFYEPKDLSYTPYGVTVMSTGQIKVSVGDTIFTVGSRFSKPGGGMLFLGPVEGEDNAGKSWDVKVTKQSELQYVVEGTTERYQLRRNIELLPNHIQIEDTLTNLTDEVQGVRFANEVRVAEFDRILMAGVPWSDTFKAINNPERPFVQIFKHNVSLGLIARDDVYRNQSVDYVERGACGVRDDNFGLPPRASYTLKWELYPINSPDPFDFYNTVRAVWGTSKAHIPGLFTFVYPQYKWSKNNKTLAEMSVEDMREWLNTNKVQYLCFVVQSDTGGVISDFGGQIEAFGSDYLNAKLGKAYWKAIVERLRKAKPDLKITPYFHAGCDLPDESLHDSRVMLIGGKHKSFTNSKKLTRPYYYPMPGNSFGRRIQDVFDMAISDFQADTFYWDEYGDGHVSVYMENVPDWDNCSVMIDSKTNEVVKKITNLALVTRPVREKLTDQSMENGRILWTNWQPTTERDTEKNIPHFLEHFYDGQYAVRGYLASPIQLDGQNAASNADVMNGAWKVLQAGLIYGHIGRSGFAESTESILGHFYPITPTELHDGYIIGKERIITSRSGAFGFGDAEKLDCVIYDASGLLKKDKGRTITQNEKTYHLVSLQAGEIAIIVRK